MALVFALHTALQGANPVGTYKLTFQPRSEVMNATIVIARRDSGGRYHASISMRQLGPRPAETDSVVVTDGRVRVYAPTDVADVTFEFGVEKPSNDNFIFHFDDGDMRGALGVERPKK